MNSQKQNNDIIIRKSNCSDESCSSESIVDKNQLNECFQKMELISTNDCQQQSFYTFKDLGIEQYLTLDNNQSLTELLFRQQNKLQTFFSKLSNHHKQIQQQFQHQSNLIYPFGVPAHFPKSFQSLSQQSIDSKPQSEVKALQQIQQINTLTIGKLTLQERANKVQKYLEKKKKRKFTQTKYRLYLDVFYLFRYVIRSEQASLRNRLHGRFVKKEFSLSDLIVQRQMSSSWDCDKKIEQKIKIKSQQKMQQIYVQNQNGLAQST